MGTERPGAEMSDLRAVLERRERCHRANYGNGEIRLMFYCPGCKEPHNVRVEGPHSWQWNGDMVKPTFNPSVNVTMDLADRTQVCHFFVRDGRIEYLGDCWHDLKGQTVEMPAWEDWP